MEQALTLGPAGALPPFGEYGDEGASFGGQFHRLKEFYIPVLVNGRFNDLNPLSASRIIAHASLPILPPASTAAACFHFARFPNPHLILRPDFSPGHIVGDHTPELIIALCHSKEFCFLLTVASYRELALPGGAKLVGPRGKPVRTDAPCIGIIYDFISVDTGNAGFVVFSEAGANPDLVIKGFVPGDERISVLDGGFQRFPFTTVDAVREPLHDDRPLSLQCDDPAVVTIGVVIYASDVTRRLLAGQARHNKPFSIEGGPLEALDQKKI